MSGATFAVALVMQIRIVGEIHPYSWTAKPCHQERVVLVVVTKDVGLPIDAGSKKGCSRMGSLWGSSFSGGPTLSQCGYFHTRLGSLFPPVEDQTFRPCMINWVDVLYSPHQFFIHPVFVFVFLFANRQIPFQDGLYSPDHLSVHPFSIDQRATRRSLLNSCILAFKLLTMRVVVMVMVMVMTMMLMFIQSEADGKKSNNSISICMETLAC